MLRKNKVLLLALAGAAVVALGVSCLWWSRPSPAVPPGESPSSAPVEEAEPAPPMLAPPATVPTPPPKPRTAPRSRPVAVPAADAGPPQCIRDQDCKGPRTADCIVPACVNGKCVYDKSRCECRSAADCDDGDPCTRNHCFVPTMKCVFIKDGCK